MMQARLHVFVSERKVFQIKLTDLSCTYVLVFFYYWLYFRDYILMRETTTLRNLGLQPCNKLFYHA